MPGGLRLLIHHSSFRIHHFSLDLLVARCDAADVVARLAEGGHAVAVARDVALARVVAGEHEVYAVVEARQKLAEVARPGADALRGVVRVAHAEARRRPRHQLHQAARAGRTDRARVEVRLLLHDAEDEVRVNALARAVLLDERVEAGAPRRPAPLAPAPAPARGVGHFVPRELHALDVVNARALDEGRDVVAPVPDPFRPLVRLVHLHLRPAGEVNPHLLHALFGLRRAAAVKRLHDRRVVRVLRTRAA